MKTTGLLIAALLAIATGQAVSQEVCNQSYLACLNRCVTKLPTVTTQDVCMQDCQRSNNSCSAKFFSAPVRSPQYVQQPTETDEAMAQSDQPAAAETPAETTRTTAPRR